LAGLLKAGKAARSAEIGSGSTPLIGAASIATPAAPRLLPISFSTIVPPNEWPIRMGGAESVPMISV
jgi:hypothetical protein